MLPLPLRLLVALEGAAALSLSEADVERLLETALNVTCGHGGECAVGIGCGIVAGWFVRRLQGAIVTAAVVGGISTGVALYQGWVTPEDVQLNAQATVRMLHEQAATHARRLDLDKDGRCWSPARLNQRQSYEDWVFVRGMQMKPRLEI
jgi:hypothetical protein